MLTIGHFIGKENKITRVMNLSKRGEETQLEFIQAYSTFSRRLFGDKLLTTRHPCRIALFTALALGRFAPSGLEQ